MDIFFQTNDPEKALALRDIECFQGDYCYRIIVRSRGFCVERRFDFDQECLEECLKNVLKMDETLAGSASLHYRYETDRLDFTVDGAGHVKVEGHIIEYGPERQELTFAFVTDQTCLRPLARDLKRCLDLSAYN